MKTKRMNNKTNNCHHVGKGKSDISRQFDELKPFLRFLRTLHMNVETKKRIIPVMIAYFRPRFTSKFTSRPANTTPKKSSPKWHIKNGCYKGSGPCSCSRKRNSHKEHQTKPLKLLHWTSLLFGILEQHVKESRRRRAPRSNERRNFFKVEHDEWHRDHVPTLITQNWFI